MDIISLILGLEWNKNECITLNYVVDCTTGNAGDEVEDVQWSPHQAKHFQYKLTSHCIGFPLDVGSTVLTNIINIFWKVALDMVDQEECISTFFQNASKAYRVTPKEDALDSSQDLSQNSTEDADMLSLSQLTIQEQEPISVQPFFNVTPRKMPFSPHYIFEEEFSSNPWAMFIATIFLTKTAGKIARPYMKGFFELYPSPYHVLDCNPVKLESFFENLGLKKRAYMIWKLSYQFVSAGWRRASDLCGIGKYGEDAYRIFCLGHSDLDPGDRYLKLYLGWLRGQTEFLEENSVIDSEFVIEELELKYYRLTLRDHVK